MSQELDEVLIQLVASRKIRPEEKTKLLCKIQEDMRLNPRKSNHNYKTRWMIGFAGCVATIVASSALWTILSHEPSTEPVISSRDIPQNSKSNVSSSLMNVGVETIAEQNWNGIVIEKAPFGTPPVVTPLHWKIIYDNTAVRGQNPKHYTLAEARTIAKFPIREPITITDWAHKESEGVQTPIQLIKNGQYAGVEYSTITYFDLYENSKGQHVAVQQELFRSAEPGTMKYSIWYKPGTQQVTGFDASLVLLIHDKQINCNELDIYHVEQSGVVTRTTITGQVDDNSLEIFGSQYMNESH